jgi:integrase
MASLSFMAGGRRRKLLKRNNGGDWYVRFMHNGQATWRSTGSTLEHVAKEKGRKIIEEEMKGDALDGNATFEQLIERFLASRQAKAQHTQENDRSFANALRTTFPRIHAPADQIRTGDILGWLNSQAPARKWRAATFNQYYLYLKQMFDLAVADRLVKRDHHPFVSGLIKRQRRQVVVRNIPTPDQFAAIIADVRANHNGDSEELGDFLEFIGLAGVGQAEARALRKCDVVGGKMRFVRKKTGRPFDVPIYAWLAPLLDRRYAMAHGHAAPLLTQAKGSGRALRAACARLGFIRFTQRGLRAMLIKRLYDEGVPVKRIALWQGHSDGGRLIQEVYTEVFCDTDAAAEQADLARIGGAVDLASLKNLRVLEPAHVARAPL